MFTSVITQRTIGAWVYQPLSEDTSVGHGRGARVWDMHARGETEDGQNVGGGGNVDKRGFLLLWFMQGKRPLSPGLGPS